MDGPTLDFLLRILGRLGFLVSVWGAYRLGRLPVLRKSSYQVLLIAGALSVLSLVVTTLDFLFSGVFINLITLGFNVGSTWILAGFFFWKLYKIKHYKIPQRIQQFQAEMNERIENLKNK